MAICYDNKALRIHVIVALAPQVTAFSHEAAVRDMFRRDSLTVQCVVLII